MGHSNENNAKNSLGEPWSLSAAEIAEIEAQAYSPEFLRMALLLGEDNCRRVYLEHHERLSGASGIAEAAMAARKGAEGSLSALGRAKSNPARAEWLEAKAIEAERRRAIERTERERAGLPCRFDRRTQEWVYPARWNPVPHVDFA